MQHQNSYSLVPPSGGELMHNRHPYPSPPKPNDLGMDRKLTIDTALASSFPVVGQLTSPANFSPASPSRKSRRNDLFDCGPSFASTAQELNVYSLDKSVSHKLKLTARFDRGFFIANQDWTCYRRNYFQVSACFSSTSNPPAVEVETPCLLEVAPGQFKVATEFMIGLTSQVLATEKKVELIQHTTKRDKGPQLIPSPRTCLPGGVLNTVPGLSFTQNVVTFERLQFKSATANNGKRRAAQQYFIVVVELWARLDDGTSAKVATTTSSPLVVRGRSPGHYADTHERIPSPLFPNTPYDSPYSPTFNNAYGSFNPYSQMQGQSQYSPVSPMNGLMSPTTPTVTNNPYVMNPIPTPTSDTSDNSNG
ncbi:hypothetical protein BKA69DRAFT_1064980 [Paraphysoderma sedebokerense]|nr:hypothetical protein BKA69DRAFT_1064980 [Paraphysoderma sedebokerense]